MKRDKRSPTNAIFFLLLIILIIYYIGYRNLTVEKEVTIPKPKPTPVFEPPGPIAKQGYLVWDTTCKIPRINPYTRAARLVERHVALNHSNEKIRELNTPLVTKHFDEMTGLYFLHINKQWKKHYVNDTEDNVTCCYTRIVAGQHEEKTKEDYKFQPCVTFGHHAELPNDIEALIVECQAFSSPSGNISRTVFETGFLLVPRPKKPENMRFKNAFGILLLGIEGLSQMGLRRWFPQTYAFLQEQSTWKELSGYNQVGDDTFTSLTALLTGLQPEEVWRQCDPTHSKTFKNCPFLWKNANAPGHITAFASDTAFLSTGRNRKSNFSHLSTNYNPQLFMDAIKHKFQTASNPDYFSSADYVYDYALEYMRSLQNRPSFSVFWLSTLKKHFEDSNVADKHLHAFLNIIHRTGLLQCYAVVLFSDHGAQTGRLSYMSTGFYEERLPVFFMSLPTELKFHHPEFLNALKLNKNRLTSALDVHVTLNHMMTMAKGKIWKYKGAPDCPTCQTLLQPVKAHRTCAEAGVDWYTCACDPFETQLYSDAKDSPMKENLAESLNNLLRAKSLLNTTCHEFQPKLMTILSLSAGQRHNKYHYLKFQVNNSDIFELAFWYFGADNVLALDGKKVKRLGKFKTSCVHGVEDSLARKLCICNIDGNKEVF